jgi:hypothetical protein
LASFKKKESPTMATTVSVFTPSYNTQFLPSSASIHGGWQGVLDQAQAVQDPQSSSVAAGSGSSASRNAQIQEETDRLEAEGRYDGSYAEDVMTRIMTPEPDITHGEISRALSNPKLSSKDKAIIGRLSTIRYNELTSGISKEDADAQFQAALGSDAKKGNDRIMTVRQGYDADPRVAAAQRIAEDLIARLLADPASVNPEEVTTLLEHPILAGALYAKIQAAYQQGQQQIDLNTAGQQPKEPELPTFDANNPDSQGRMLVAYLPNFQRADTNPIQAA